jgi:hypothetical protein
MILDLLLDELVELQLDLMNRRHYLGYNEDHEELMNHLKKIHLPLKEKV